MGLEVWASSSAGDHRIIRGCCVSGFIQRTCRNAGDEDGVSSHHVSTSGNRRAEERRETKAARGRPAKGAKKAANRQHGRQGRQGRSRSDALGPIYARDWIKCYMCRQWGQYIAAKCTRTQAECDKLTPGAKLPPSGAAKDSVFNPN
jgi:hypothetical protein